MIWATFVVGLFPKTFQKYPNMVTLAAEKLKPYVKSCMLTEHYSCVQNVFGSK